MLSISRFSSFHRQLIKNTFNDVQVIQSKVIVHTTTSNNNSPLVPWRIFTKFPTLFSQMYKACCLAEPATINSPSPEKQHFFHRVLKRSTYLCEGRSCSFWTKMYLLTRSCNFCIDDLLFDNIMSFLNRGPTCGHDFVVLCR